MNELPPTQDELTTARNIIERLFWSLPRTAHGELVALDDALGRNRRAALHDAGRGVNDVPFSMSVTWEVEDGRRAVLHFMDGVPDTWEPGRLARHASGAWFHIMRIPNNSTAVGMFVRLHVIAYGPHEKEAA